MGRTSHPRRTAPTGIRYLRANRSRYLKRVGRNRDKNKAKNWLAFLNNHREVIAAFDFFIAPTMTFRVLYGFFVIEHSRRRILHFNATAHPTSVWMVQQLRDALPLPSRYRYVLFDHDAKFGRDMGIPQGKRHRADS